MEEQVLGRMDRLLQLPIGTLSGDERLDELENWDSMSVIEFMTLADEEFSIKLDPSLINDAETIDNLIDLLK
ncbi:MAG: acyl carrier protein [Gammaproteobacteria bacterium]|nr:acyl carrier protein [Gammaproteobacteria bacterium]